MRLLAAGDPFGQIKPTGLPGTLTGDPLQAVGNLFAFGIKMFLIVAGLFLLIYLLWGALDWVTSAGEKEKISKAQGKITNAVIGLFLIIFALAAFTVITGDILGIIKYNNGWIIDIPTIGP